jgi:hypothetical protein
VMMPPAAILFLLGFGKVVFDIFDKNWRMGTNTIVILGAAFAIAMLGMVADLMLQKKEVTHVTVVELDPDVIQLTARWLRKKHITNDRLTIIQGNALTYKHIAGTKWNVVWHDIWPDISEENLTDMHKLHRSFGGRCDWQGSWARELCERY